MLLLQPKTEDSHRIKIHVLDNDVDKNVLKTSDASCLCHAGLTTMIKDFPRIVTIYLQLSVIKIPKNCCF